MDYKSVKEIAAIPLTEFMKALGQEQPVYADGNLRRYNAPYSDDKDASMVVNIETNQWRDVRTGAYGGIYDLAYELTGSTSMRGLSEYIVGQMNRGRDNRIEEENREIDATIEKYRIKKEVQLPEGTKLDVKKYDGMNYYVISAEIPGKGELLAEIGPADYIAAKIDAKALRQIAAEYLGERIESLVNRENEQQEQQPAGKISVEDFERIRERMVENVADAEEIGLYSEPLQQCTNFKELTDLIKDKFNFMNGEIASVIVDNAKAFRSAGIYVNEDVNDGYMVCDKEAHSAYGKSQVFACSGAKVTAHDDSVVHAIKLSQIEAYDRTVVCAYGETSVGADDESKVWAYEGAIVIAKGKSKVTGFDLSHVIAHDNARVIAREKSHVQLRENSHCDAYDEADVNSVDHSFVDAYDKSKVHSCGSSVVRAYSEGVKLTGKDVITVRNEMSPSGVLRTTANFKETEKFGKYYIHASAGPLGDTPKSQIDYKEHVKLRCGELKKQDLADKYLGAAMQDLFDGKYKVSEQQTNALANKGPKR